MKKKFLIILILFSQLAYAQEPGSGYTLNFDGSNDYVSVPHDPSLKPNDFITIEAWINPVDIETNRYYEIYRKEDGADRHLFSFQEFGTILSFGISTGGAYAELDVSITASDYENQWVHVAAVYDGTNKTIYRNGIAIGSAAASGSIGVSGSRPAVIGAWAGTSEFFYGKIDEVRLWSVPLTQTEIRDWMCKKTTSSHPHYSSLISYYRFDENTGTTLFDDAGSNNGTLINGPTYTLSGAPIGNENAYQYAGTPTVTLSHPDGDNLTINSFTGTPTGAYIYRVDAAPNDLTGTSGVGENDKYFGVFKIGDAAATYTVTYDYTGNPGVGANETDLVLFKRTDNSTNWLDANATLDIESNTLIATGENTEYILGSSGIPLPVELLSFTAKVTMDNNVQLDWKTISEIDNDYFTVQRSKKGLNWEAIDKIDGAGNSSSTVNYTTIDKNPLLGVSYYRLKQTDFDGQFSYSQVRSVNKYILIDPQIKVYPNPTTSQVSIVGDEFEFEELKINNILGQDVTRRTKVISMEGSTLVVDLSSLKTGIYYIKTKTTVNKLYKQ